MQRWPSTGVRTCRRRRPRSTTSCLMSSGGCATVGVRTVRTADQKGAARTGQTLSCQVATLQSHGRQHPLWWLQPLRAPYGPNAPSPAWHHGQAGKINQLWSSKHWPCTPLSCKTWCWADPSVVFTGRQCGTRHGNVCCMQGVLQWGRLHKVSVGGF